MAMKSKIEQSIDEIEEYIESCKSQALSSGSRIIVNREDIIALLSQLRSNVPKEIQHYQKIVSNKEAIMADARARADEMLAQAQVTTHELISEHEIMQQAYAQANEVVMIATKQAQEILDNATNDANSIRMGAIAYTDDMLKSMEEIIAHSIETARVRTDNFANSLQEYLNIISANRAELVPQEVNQEQPTSEPLDVSGVTEPQE